MNEIGSVPKDGQPYILYTGVSNSDEWPVIAAWKESYYWVNGEKWGGPRYGWVKYFHDQVDEEFNAYFKPTHWDYIPGYTYRC